MTKLIVILIFLFLLGSMTGVVFGPSASGEWVQKYSEGKTNFSTRTFTQCWDGGFVIAGVTVAGPLLLKTDSNGSVEWEKPYEGTVNDYPDSLIELSIKGMPWSAGVQSC